MACINTVLQVADFYCFGSLSDQEMNNTEFGDDLISIQIDLVNTVFFLEASNLNAQDLLFFFFF